MSIIIQNVSKRFTNFTALDNASPYREAIEAYLGFRKGVKH